MRAVCVVCCLCRVRRIVNARAGNFQVDGQLGHGVARFLHDRDCFSECQVPRAKFGPDAAPAPAQVRSGQTNIDACCGPLRRVCGRVRVIREGADLSASVSVRGCLAHSATMSSPERVLG